MEENIEFCCKCLNFEVSVEEPSASARQETGLGGYGWTQS